jgi:hypothetical protein
MQQQHRFQAGDRVMVVDDRAAGVPRGTLGTVVRSFAPQPEVCNVRFDGRLGVRAILTSALAPAPPDA